MYYFYDSKGLIGLSCRQTLETRQFLIQKELHFIFRLAIQVISPHGFFFQFRVGNFHQHWKIVAENWFGVQWGTYLHNVRVLVTSW